MCKTALLRTMQLTKHMLHHLAFLYNFKFECYMSQPFGPHSNKYINFITQTMSP